MIPNIELEPHQCYNGNSFLKAARVNLAYTTEMISEMKKCLNDPIHFMTTYVKVSSADGGDLVPFAPHEYQKRLITSYIDNRFTVSIQPRQMGKTTTTAAFCLWQILFEKNYCVALLANKASAATEILTRIKDMYENLPVWLQKGVKRWNMKDILLENGSKVFCAATTAAGIRGKTVSLLVIDEAAIIPNTVADSFFTGTIPVISSGSETKIAVISTPLGYNHFWKMWNEAEQGINGFVPIRVHWWEHPDRDQDWADNMLRLLGDVKYAQEVECSFQGSAFTLISGKKLSELSPHVAVQKDEFLFIYEHEQKDHNYVMVVDPAEGIGADYAAINIIDITSKPYKQVAAYRNNKISPIVLPDVAYGLATKYNKAFILCEINKFESVADTLYNEYEYERIFAITVNSKDGQFINNGFGGKIRYGVLTDKKVKRIGCSNLKDLVEADKLLICDSNTISELTSFIQKKNSFEADDGYTDDLVMTLVLFSWLTRQPLFDELAKDASRRELFKSNIERAYEELLPFGFRIDGTENSNDGWLDVGTSAFSFD